MDVDESSLEIPNTVVLISRITQQMKTPATQDRILHAAEEAFAVHGFNGVSLRDIVKRAKVNLAAVNYHFDDLESLYLEVVRRRIRPLNQTRLALIDAAVQEAGGELPSMRSILDILIRPVFEVHRNPARGGHHFVRIMARCLSEPLPFMEGLLAEDFHPALTRFSQMLRRHLPKLAPDDFVWRMSFIVGAMQHTLGTLHQMHALTRGICADNDYEGALARFVEAAEAVLKAPPLAARE